MFLLTCAGVHVHLLCVLLLQKIGQMSDELSPQIGFSNRNLTHYVPAKLKNSWKFETNMEKALKPIDLGKKRV